MSELRRRYKQVQSFRERLRDDAKRCHEEAKLLPPGALRDALLRRASQSETASLMNGRVRSPSLQPPK